MNQFCEHCDSRGVRHKKVCPTLQSQQPLENPTEVPQETKEEQPGISSLMEKIASLEKKDEENQKKLKMLYEVADKGRIFNYESQRAEKKPLKVKLSVHSGNIVVGWRTIKDVLIKNPTTGLTVGEEQQYEILLLDLEGKITKSMVEGYPRFSEIRYTERIECEVIGKREDSNGNITFNINLPDGRIIDLDQRFIN